MSAMRTGRMSTHRIPFTLVGSVNTTAATARLDEGAFRNDTVYPFEVYGLGFSLQNAFASQADQDFRDVGLSIRDIWRDLYWTREGQYPRLSTLVDIAGGKNPAGRQDIWQLHGTQWRLRYPSIIPGGQKLAIEARNYISTTGVNLTVTVFGALLVESDDERFALAAERFSQWAVPFGDPPRHSVVSPLMPKIPGWPAPVEGNVIAFERVPFVMTGDAAMSGEAASNFTESDFRNDTGYDMHVYEIGFSLSTQEDASLSANGENIAEINVRLSDLGRGIRMSSNIADTRLSTLVGLNTSRMGIGPAGTEFHATKLDIGAGFVLPNGAGLKPTCRSPNGTGTPAPTLTMTAIGDLLVPVCVNSVVAECWEKHMVAVPYYW